MNITIKKMETDDELEGRAFVYWKSWHEVYLGLVSEDYLDRLTLERCEEMARKNTADTLVAKDGDRVVGFVGFGDRGDEAPGVGEVFLLYVLSEYRGAGVGKMLLNAALEQLREDPQVCLWVLKENHRAIRFYEKCGFRPDGEEHLSPATGAMGIRMRLER